jgi:hypothetical protein
MPNSPASVELAGMVGAKIMKANKSDINSLEDILNVMESL